MLSYLYSLRDFRESFSFERRFPKPLKWDDRFKQYQLSTRNMACQGIWIRGQPGLVAEAILTWESSSVLHIRSFAVLAGEERKGYGNDLVRTVIAYAETEKYTHLTAMAPPGAAARILENFFFEPMLEYADYKGTGTTFTSYKLAL